MGKTRTSPVLIIGGIALIVLIAGMFWFMTSQSQIGADKDLTPEGDLLSPCDIDTTFDLSVVNALSQGTTVSPTINAKIDGGATKIITSSTTFRSGISLEVFINSSDYIDKNVGTFDLICGPNAETDTMYATSANAFRLYNEGNDVLTDSNIGGSVNQTQKATTITLNGYIDGTSKESTGDLVIVVEATNTTQVDKVHMSGTGVSDADVPSFYSNAKAGSITKAFLVKEVLNGDSVPITISLTPESGVYINWTSVYVTAYSLQDFIDTDGTYQSGAEDSDGTDMTEDNWDFDFCIMSDATADDGGACS